ncbi:MAG: hypothetical protein CVU89_12770 [Firmicutes bacterium HGW-Firmicutes-14]|nr:MAG: hypothetical protein CVU89_12770 [Firmicutes bacterium HGW-Firmicutes-14]
MSYDIFIHKFVHPFIIYVLIGTLVSYLLALLVSRFPIVRNSGSGSLVYGIPFIVPFVAYFSYRPFIIDKCAIYGHPLGIINDWLCFGGEVLAVILTPLFGIVFIIAITKALLSIFASRKLAKKYGFASPAVYPGVFMILEQLCAKSEINMPRVIITGDPFARSFTMGYRSPVIVFSKGVLGILDEDELETVIAHELGHIVRADSMMTWVMVFLRDLMFFTPAIYWVFRDFAFEKEKACDDIVVRLTNKPMAFSQALIKVWKLSPRTFFDRVVLDNFMPHPNLVGSSGILEHRVTRILNGEPGIINNSPISHIIIILTAVFSVFLLYWVC